MKPQILIDLVAVVTIVVGFIAVVKAIRSAINTALEPLQEKVVALAADIVAMDKLVLTEPKHKLICNATRERIETMEKTLCAKIQLLINVIGVRGKSPGSQRVSDKDKLSMEETT